MVCALRMNFLLRQRYCFQNREAMKSSLSKIARGMTLFVGMVFLATSASGQEAPDRIILFIIDGLAVQAPERVEMPHYNVLKQEGVYYEAMHLPLPGHPDKGPDYPWGCSLPNPMLMSGTPFVGRAVSYTHLTLPTKRIV